MSDESPEYSQGPGPWIQDKVDIVLFRVENHMCYHVPRLHEVISLNIECSDKISNVQDDQYKIMNNCNDVLCLKNEWCTIDSTLDPQRK